MMDLGDLPWRVDIAGDYPNPRIIGASGKAVGFAVQRDDWAPGDGVPLRLATDRARIMSLAPEMMQALREIDRIMGHDDEATEWRDRWAHLFFWGQ